MTANPTASRRADHLTLSGEGAAVSTLVGILATFGVLMSAGVAAVVVAGMLQWSHGLPTALDNGIPLVVLFLGMMLSGRVAVDVAGKWAPVSVVGTAVIVTVLGMAVSRTSEAHGDAIEPWQVAVATVVVLIVVGASSWLVRRQRSRRLL